MATKENMAKAERLWNAIGKEQREDHPFPVAVFSKLIEEEEARMAQEDKDRLIPCSCHGDMHPARDVDIWGICPYGRVVK